MIKPDQGLILAEQCLAGLVSWSALLHQRFSGLVFLLFTGSVFSCNHTSHKQDHSSEARFFYFKSNCRSAARAQVKPLRPPLLQCFNSVSGLHCHDNFHNFNFESLRGNAYVYGTEGFVSMMEPTSSYSCRFISSKADETLFTQAIII